MQSAVLPSLPLLVKGQGEAAPPFRHHWAPSHAKFYNLSTDRTFTTSACRVRVLYFFSKNWGLPYPVPYLRTVLPSVLLARKKVPVHKTVLAPKSPVLVCGELTCFDSTGYVGWQWNPCRKLIVELHVCFTEISFLCSEVKRRRSPVACHRMK